MNDPNLMFIVDIFDVLITKESRQSRLQTLWSKYQELLDQKEKYEYYEAVSSFIIGYIHLLNKDHAMAEIFFQKVNSGSQSNIFEPLVKIGLGYTNLNRGKRSPHLIDNDSTCANQKSTDTASNNYNYAQKYLEEAVEAINNTEELKNVLPFAYMGQSGVFYEMADIYYNDSNKQDHPIQEIENHSVRDNNAEALYEQAFLKLVESEIIIYNQDSSRTTMQNIPYIWNKIGDILQKMLRPAKEVLAEKGLIINNKIDNTLTSDNFALAKAYYNLAIIESKTFAYPHNGIGRIMKKSGNYEEAIIYFQTATKIKPDFSYPYTYMGDCYLALGDYDMAIDSYQKALDLEKYESSMNNNQEPIKFRVITYSLYGLGKVYYEKGKSENPVRYYTIAEDYLRAAHRLQPNFPYVNMHLGRLLLRRSLYETMQEKQESSTGLKQAQEFFENAAIGFDNRGLVNRVHEMKDNLEMIDNIIQFFPEFSSQEKPKQESSNELCELNIKRQLYKEVMRGTLYHIDAEQFTNKKAFLRFLWEGPQYLTNSSGDNIVKSVNNEFEFGLEVLRRWNSYTPLVTGETGGGYFIKINGQGIVIDPGYGFIQNYRTSGHKFHEINSIFVSHAHDDHTADLESIINLLYKYNKELKSENIGARIARDKKYSKKDLRKTIIIGDLNAECEKLDKQINKIKEEINELKSICFSKETNSSTSNTIKEIKDKALEEIVKLENELPHIYHKYEERMNKLAKLKMSIYFSEEKKHIYRRINDEFASRKKTINLIFPSEVERKFSGLFDINSAFTKDDDQIRSEYVLLEKKNIDDIPFTTPFSKLKRIDLSKCSGISAGNILLFKVKHQTFMGKQDQGYGFALYNNGKSLVYTADTGFDENILETFKELKEKLQSEHNNSSNDMVLIAHMGGFDEKENTIATQFNKIINETTEQTEDTDIYEESFYANHLGRLGLVETCYYLQPTLCIISEFGEEFKGLRADIANVFNHSFIQYKFNTRFLPGDYGLKINLGVRKSAQVNNISCKSCTNSTIQIWAIVGINKYSYEIEEDWIDYSCVNYGELKEKGCIYYYHDGLDQNEIIEAIMSQYNCINNSSFAPIKP